MRSSFVLLASIALVACSSSSSSSDTSTTNPGTGGASAAGGGSVTGGGAGQGGATGGQGGSAAGQGGSIAQGGSATGGASAGQGGASAGQGGASAGQGGATTGGAAGSTAGAGGSSTGPCPATAPNVGDPCDVSSTQGFPGPQCTYGDEVVGLCRLQLTCENGVWTNPNFMANCPPSGSGTCPSTPPMNGASCATDGAYCGFGDGTICLCASCHGGGACMPKPPTWECSPPSNQPGCPAIEPNAGTPCDAGMQFCGYGPTCTGAQAVCTDGFWQWQILACGAPPG